MDFTKQEMQAVELVIVKVDEVVSELTELELAYVGGGSGAISLG